MGGSRKLVSISTQLKFIGTSKGYEVFKSDIK